VPGARTPHRPTGMIFRLSAIAMLVGCAHSPSHTNPAVTSTDSEQIAAARARSNAAIAAHDTAAIAREWMPDIHVVSSTSSQAAGADANAKSMQAAFTRRPDTKWVRTPRTIRVFDAWQVASEEGDWVGTWTDPDGPVRIGGTYLAQWRRVDGHWRIQAEVFVPLTCDGGAYCARHP
jgi:ketosteroid isomerase-like protein